MSLFRFSIFKLAMNGNAYARGGEGGGGTIVDDLGG